MNLSDSTSEFRNAFLKTIRQIIRESVRNMNLPPLGSVVQVGGGSHRKNKHPSSMGRSPSDVGDASEDASDEDDDSRQNNRPLPPPPPPHHSIVMSGTASMGRAAAAGGGGVRPRPPIRAHGSSGGSLQRHSSGGDLDYDNVENCGRNSRVRARSRTLGDGMGENKKNHTVIDLKNILWMSSDNFFLKKVLA